jgi:hypothetical protein
MAKRGTHGGAGRNKHFSGTGKAAFLELKKARPTCAGNATRLPAFCPSTIL